MNEIDFVKLLGQSGITVGALVALAYIIKRIGERMIEALDQVRKGLYDLREEIKSGIGNLRTDVAVMSGRVDMALTGTGERPVTRSPAPVARADAERKS